MKKSHALMLSYMVFLSITIIAQVFFLWDGLDRISMAATIAGCFFAFADLANWYVSNNMPFIEAVQKDTDAFYAICNAQVESVNARRQEMLEIITILTPHRDKDDVDSVIEICEEQASEYTVIIDDAQKITDDGNKKMNSLVNREKKKVILCQNTEIFLVTLGFVVFFILLSFDYFANILEPYQSIATVLAFIIIMLNYFLRDILDDITKHKIEEILSRVECQKAEVAQIKESAKGTPELDIFKTLVKKMEDLEHHKSEESEHEQTKNALPEQG